MPAVSQGLVDFANNLRQQAAPGVEVIVTPRYQITLQPDHFGRQHVGRPGRETALRDLP